MKYFTDTLRSLHCQFWKEALYKFYKKNSNMVLCYIPFPSKKLPPKTKVYKPALDPSTKQKNKIPNYYDLCTMLCQNGKEFSFRKGNNAQLPTCLVDSMRFILTVEACFYLQIYVVNIVNCFQSTICDPKDKFHICLHPFHVPLYLSQQWSYPW